MAISFEPTQEQRDNLAARIGAIFDLPDAASKISRDGVHIESFEDGALLTVELVSRISMAEANAIISGLPAGPEGQNTNE